MNTVEQGRIGEAIVVTELVKQGYEVYMPVFGNAEVDMIAAKDGQFLKVEVKTTRKPTKSGRYVAKLQSVRPNKTANILKNFDGQRADILAVVTLPTGRVHLLDAKQYDQRTSVTVDG